MRTLTRDRARRLALGAQGFSEQRPGGRIDVRHFRKVLATVGLLQLDTVNVLVRAHYLPLFSRLGPYDRHAFDRWTAGSGELFEYWGHEASLLPVHLYPYFRFRMEAIAAKPWRWIRELREQRPGYIEEVFAQVETRGPLSTADLDDPGERGGPWWGYQPGKKALEWLFATGRVAAYRTATFGRLYDLPERVLPATIVDVPSPGKMEAYGSLLIDAARHHGVGTAGDLADYHRLHTPTAREVVDHLAASGDLEEVRVQGWKQPAFVHPDAVVPRKPTGTALLSPFDSLVFNRDRVERLFDFRYRIEIYVPRQKREYGYYVLPFLCDGELVARVDLKADRKRGALLVQASHLEPDAAPSVTAGALAGELKSLAEWLDMSEVVVSPNGDLASRLSSAVG
ncbi:MAG: winged helix-turn-helix domain-containing protein [Acidimicrobiia bacterium]|nr:MAG: winged helix-turn-helix domain-containing protein [Acidimicrobiia bacterium]